MKNTKRNMIVSIAPILLAFSIGATSLSLATSVAGAQMYKSSSSMMGGAGQNQSKMMMGTSGPNITGTIQLGPIIAKAISSQVHVSLLTLQPLQRNRRTKCTRGSIENRSSPWIFSIHGSSCRQQQQFPWCAGRCWKRKSPSLYSNVYDGDDANGNDGSWYGG